MKRTVSKTGVRIVGVFFVLVGCFFLLETYNDFSYILLGLAFLAFAGGVGAILLRSWSKYAVAVVSAPIIVQWFYLAVHFYWFNGLREPFHINILMALPGATLMFILFASSWVLFRYFGEHRELPEP